MFSQNVCFNAWLLYLMPWRAFWNWLDCCRWVYMKLVEVGSCLVLSFPPLRLFWSPPPPTWDPSDCRSLYLWRAPLWLGIRRFVDLYPAIADELLKSTSSFLPTYVFSNDFKMLSRNLFTVCVFPLQRELDFRSPTWDPSDVRRM